MCEWHIRMYLPKFRPECEEPSGPQLWRDLSWPASSTPLPMGARCLLVTGPVPVCEVVRSQLQDLLWANCNREEQLEVTQVWLGSSAT